MSVFVVVLAAGQGTRMKSPEPKVLHRVLGRTMLGHVIHQGRRVGAERIVIVVGHGRKTVEAVVRAEEGGDGLDFVVQHEQLGTGHAVLQAKELLLGEEGLTLILTGDVPSLRLETLKAFVEAARTEPLPLHFMSCHVPDPKGYGRILRGADGQVLRSVEHLDATEEERKGNEINVGVYIFNNTFLWANLEGVANSNANGEYYLPDLIKAAVDKGGARAFVVSDPNETEGVNTRVQLAQAERVARGRRNEALMLAGVTMIDPATTYVDADVVIEENVFLEPGVRLTGTTRVATGVHISQGSVIENSSVGKDVLIKPYSHIESSIIRAGAQIGPFAHLRPQSDIGQNAKVGNFVETKKTKIGDGSKASHLTYLGDSVIGANCNIGAGTITCNYDGSSKSPTTLGDRVFIGSNVALVAPVTLGDGAYVGAGSVITQNIPEDALGVARGRQRNIANWARRSSKIPSPEKK